MATIWITYAWEDNREGDVDFVAQEFKASGVDVKLDRWNLSAGKRLWEQIQDFIINPYKSDAWLLYATQNSLGSEACKEEFTYALDRALNTRGKSYPVIALFPAPIDYDLIPPGIRTRLYVSLTDPDWKERIIAAAEGRQPTISHTEINPYIVNIHTVNIKGKNRFVIELRPRAGTWAPFFAAIPIKEKEELNPSIIHGPKGIIPSGGMLMMSGSGKSSDGLWWIMYAGNEASPTQSYYVFCDKLPNKLMYGVKNGHPQYKIALDK